MIEINLIPDVKSELLKAQSLRNFIIFISTVVSLGAIAIVVLISGTVFIAQPLLMNAKDSEIKTTFAQLKDQPNIESTVTLQNQLNQIDSLRLQSPNTSRILGQILVAIQPTGDNSVAYSGIDYDPETKTLSIEGESSGGFPALESFRKTIAETKIVYRDEHKDKDCTASDLNSEDSGCISESLTSQDVLTLEQSLGQGDDGARVLRFKVSFVLNENALSFAAKDFAVLPPGRKDVTDSKTQIPDDIFKARSDDEGDE